MSASVEIESFNALFFEADRLGFRLNSFHQMPDKTFAANWRKDNMFFDVVKADKPFLAARDSLLVAIATEKPKVVVEEWD